MYWTLIYIIKIKYHRNPSKIGFVEFVSFILNASITNTYRHVCTSTFVITNVGYTKQNRTYKIFFLNIFVQHKWISNKFAFEQTFQKISIICWIKICETLTAAARKKVFEQHKKILRFSPTHLEKSLVWGLD